MQLNFEQSEKWLKEGRYSDRICIVEPFLAEFKVGSRDKLTQGQIRAANVLIAELIQTL